MIKILTKRQTEFLDVIERLFKETKQPVHYETVGHALGVSKWTAYDLINVLAKKRVVDIVYLTDKSKTQVGRSRMGVIPRDASLVGESSVIRDKRVELLTIIQQWQTNLKQINLRTLVKEAMNCSSPELNCLYIITIVVLILKQKQKLGAIAWFEGLLASVNPEVSLVAGVGLVIGMLLNSVNKGDANDLIESLREQLIKTQSVLSQISDDERTRLSKFWKRALEESQLI